MDINIRIAGEAGQGVQSVGGLLVGALAAQGLHVLATQSYMSRIRGGLNWFDVRVGDSELHGPREKADLLVALTDAALRVLGGELTSHGLAIFDGEQAGGAAAIPFTAVAKELAQSAVMANTVAAGAVYRALGYDLEFLSGHLRKLFAKKGDEIVEKNLRCAARGAELAEGLAGKLEAPRAGRSPRSVVSGASAIGLGAATAGVKLVAAYPMTPGTGVLTDLAARADRYGIVVEQAEDEIAAINMVCGAVYAGAPALATTSGGGFALMVEGLSLAGMMELPAVVVIAQRPGPATGLPTRTAQQDLRFAVHAGHGEFARAIYAPGTHAQCFELTRRALETAHRFQTPALILTDQYLQDVQKNIEPLDESPRPIDRCLTAGGADSQRYAVTDSGVSPRAVPGGDAFVVCDSDEHTPDGHITEDIDAHLAQTEKRLRKLRAMTAEALPPALYGPADAQTLLICWGSTYGPCREAVDRLNDFGGSYEMLHFPQVWPINAPAVSALLGWRQRVIVVEGNQTAQFAGILKEHGVIGPVETCLRYDGLPFTAEYIMERVRR